MNVMYVYPQKRSKKNHTGCSLGNSKKGSQYTLRQVNTYL